MTDRIRLLSLCIILVWEILGLLMIVSARYASTPHPAATPTPTASLTPQNSVHVCLPPLCRLVPGPVAPASPAGSRTPHSDPRPSPTRASRSRDEIAPKGYTESLSVTCYLPDGSKAADGSTLEPGMAAGPKGKWKFGQRLYVPGFGTVTIHDTIGHGSDLDLYMTSASECAAWGRRQKEVVVL